MPCYLFHPDPVLEYLGATISKSNLEAKGVSKPVSLNDCIMLAFAERGSNLPDFGLAAASTHIVS